MGAWLYPITLGNQDVVVAMFTTGGSLRQYMRLSGTSGALQAHIAAATTDADAVSNTGLLVANSWQCVFFTYDHAASAMPKIYRGDLDSPVIEASYASQTGSSGDMTGGGSVFCVGRRNTDTGFALEGRVARPFNGHRIWSLDEMEAFRLGRLPIQSGVLRVFFPLTSPTASQAEDMSGNGLNGTVSGATVVEDPPIPYIWSPASPTGPVVVPVAGGQTISVGQALETDTAQAVTPNRSEAVGQAIETDTAQSVTPIKGYAVGQAVETDTAQAVTPKTTRLVAQAVETDTAQTVTPSLSVAPLIAPAREALPRVAVEIAFPTHPMTIPAESEWTDVTAYVRELSIRRGRSHELDRFQAGECDIRLDNRDRRFDPMYPGPFGITAVDLDGTNDYVSTPDSGVLDITGDVDLRAVVVADSFSPFAFVIDKMDQGTKSGYRLGFEAGGLLRLDWGDGAANHFISSSPYVITTGVLWIVRGTLDVVSGGNHVVTFYVKTVGSGPIMDQLKSNSGWTQVDQSTIGGTTSIAANSLPVTVGLCDLGGTFFNGRVVAAAVHSGIDGTVVADPDFSKGLNHSTSSFIDAAGRTWTYNNGAAQSLHQTNIAPRRRIRVRATHSDLNEVGLSFDGSTSQYALKSSFSSFPTTAITLEGFVTGLGAASGNNSDECPFSYFVANDQFQIRNLRDLRVVVNNSELDTNVDVLGDRGYPRHLAVVWRSSDGMLRVYVDGALRFEGTHQAGASIAGSGTVVLAQEQDSAGGGFSATQALKGMLREVRLWNIARTQHAIHGDVFRSLQEVADPSFELNDGSWYIDPIDTGGAVPWAVIVDPANARRGNNVAARGPGSGSWAGFDSRKTSVAPGDKLFAVAWVKSTAGANGSCDLYFHYYDAAGAPLSYSAQLATAAAPQTTYVRLSGTDTVPAGAAFVSLEIAATPGHTAGTWYADTAFVAIIPVGLVSYWPLDEVGGTTAGDLAGANDLTITGATRAFMEQDAPRFEGFIESWQTRYNGPDSEAIVKATDGLALLATLRKPPSPYRQTVLAQVPYLYWPLDEDGRTAKDISGNARDGAYDLGVSQGVSTPFPLGDSGKAVGFAPNLRVKSVVATVAQFERTQAFSCSILFRYTGSRSQIGIIGIFGNFNTSANNRGWGMSVTNIGLDWRLTSTLTTNMLDVDGLMMFMDGHWHHLACTYDGSSSPSGMKHYVDGELLGTTTDVNNLSATIVDAGNFFRIGFRGTDTSDRYEACHAGVWDRVLSASEVKAQYEAAFQPWESERTDVRAGRLLDFHGWPATGRDLRRAVATMAAVGDALENSLDHVHGAALLELAGFYADPLGRLVFDDRYVNSFDTPIFATFGDLPGEVRYAELNPSADSVDIGTEVVTRRTPDGTAFVSSDTPAEGDFAPVQITLEGPWSDDEQPREVGARLLERIKATRLRVESMSPSYPLDWKPILRLRMHRDRVRVNRRPQDSSGALIGSVFSRDAWIESITESYLPGRSARITLGLAPDDGTRSDLFLIGRSALDGTAKLA